MSLDWSDLGPVNADALDVADLSNGLNDELRARVKSELEPGERLLCSANSSPPPVPIRVGYFAAIAIVVAMALLIGGIKLIASDKGPRVGHANRESPTTVGIIISIAGSLMVAATIGIWSGVLKERSRQAGVCYAVTDRRVIFWTPEPRSDAVRVVSVRRGEIQHVVRVQCADGSGNLELQPSSNVQYYPFPKELRYIPEVRRVEQIIRNNLMTDRKGTQDERDRSEAVGEIT